MNLHQTTLSNGIRVVAEPIPTVQSLTVSLWIRAGSRDELPHQHGIAHFLEHMLFKGTQSRSAVQIAQDIEGRGGVLNASTGKELTFYYARMLAEHMPIAVEVLSDLFLNARLDPQDIGQLRVLNKRWERGKRDFEVLDGSGMRAPAQGTPITACPREKYAPAKQTGY